MLLVVFGCYGMIEKLKPCLCTKVIEVARKKRQDICTKCHKDYNGCDNHTHMSKLMNCKTYMQFHAIIYYAQEAIVAWNTRAEQDKLQAELDRLEDKIDEDLIPTLAYIKTVVMGEVPEDSVKIQRIQKALKDF